MNFISLMVLTALAIAVGVSFDAVWGFLAEGGAICLFAASIKL